MKTYCKADIVSIVRHHQFKTGVIVGSAAMVMHNLAGRTEQIEVALSPTEFIRLKRLWGLQPDEEGNHYIDVINIGRGGVSFLNCDMVAGLKVARRNTFNVCVGVKPPLPHEAFTFPLSKIKKAPWAKK